MNAADVRSPPRLHLAVRNVEVITGRGRSVLLPNVRCPVRGRTAPVEECAHCGQTAEIAQDVPARDAWLCCDARPGAGPAGGGAIVAAVLGRAAVALRPRVSAGHAAAALRARGQPGAPVVDGEGRPVGWVGEGELLRAVPGARVSDVMDRTALAVADGASIPRAAALMAAHGVDRMPVVSSEGVVVGVLSALDLVAWLAEPGEARDPAA